MENGITVTLEQQDAFSFLVRFDDTALSPLLTDEPAPLGHDQGPNPSRLLLSAVANCLSASFLFALQKFKNSPGKIVTQAHASFARNAENRWRIAQITVNIQIDNDADELQNLDRVMAQFESFCVVTQSVRDGVEVSVNVQGKNGQRFIVSV